MSGSVRSLSVMQKLAGPALNYAPKHPILRCSTTCLFRKCCCQKNTSSTTGSLCSISISSYRNIPPPFLICDRTTKLLVPPPIKNGGGMFRYEDIEIEH